MSLPGSGTIKLSEIKAEFGKGNNLLDYLGEGGVTASPPLKLTDFYGTAAGPQVPSGPIHNYSNRIHYHANNNTAYNVVTVAGPYNEGDVVLEGGHYTYGSNSNPSGLYCDINKTKLRKNIGKHYSTSPPLRWGVGISVITGNHTEMKHTWAGAGYDPYWPDDWTGYAFKIAKADVPFDTNASIEAGSSTTGRVQILNGRAVPNSVAIAVCVSANQNNTPPTFTDVAAVQGGTGRRAGACSVAYQYIPVDGAGNADYTFQTSGWMACAWLYQRSTRDLPPLDEEQEEVADTGLIVPTPPPEDE